MQKADGRHCYTVLEQEPGSGGKNTVYTYKTRVSAPGYYFYEDPVSVNKESKEFRARPVSIAAGNGMIRIVDFPKRKQWYGDVMGQLEVFPKGQHDDAVDVLAGAYNMICKFIRTDAQYIGKIDTTLSTLNEDYAPAYKKDSKNDAVISMLESGDIVGLMNNQRLEKENRIKTDKEKAISDIADMLRKKR
jgi:hypothetical protein